MDYPEHLKRKLILDELFDLSLYKLFLKRATGETKKTLEHLVEVETKHVQIWQDVFGLRLNELNFLRKTRLFILHGFCRVFGEKAMHLILESIEVYGIKKYLRIWEHYKDDPKMRPALEEILTEELEHEDHVVSGLIQQQIFPSRIRNFFLGFNDGLVEITGAVGGFFAAFSQIPSIIIASTTVAMAGAFSMAAGAFIATESEQEVDNLEREKKRFLGKRVPPAKQEGPVSSGALVGIAYIFGAAVPILPVIFGAQNLFYSLISGIVVISVISYLLAFISGMEPRRRVIVNALIMAAAVGITYLIGNGVEAIWGIEV